ncbi:transcription factor TGA7-like [Abrus precatorius]|uniref:Transcription factor TGA7-like n=1 Tax=Abrus precatorius TaxID=3816 RepID=A0A8B8MMB4_ABRPR|nr:transcription factor TGA7-like [Abrus precatorius]
MAANAAKYVENCALCFSCSWNVLLLSELVFQPITGEVDLVEDINLYCFKFLHLPWRLAHKDAYSVLSWGAFAIMSLGLARQTHCGFEVDLLYFFCGGLMVQLMTIKLWLVIVGGSFSYSLIILSSSLDAPLGSVIQMDSPQANFGIDGDLEDPLENVEFHDAPINSNASQLYCYDHSFMLLESARLTCYVLLSLVYVDAMQKVNYGITMFEIEYEDWVEEQDRQHGELKNALQTNASDMQLGLLVQSSLNHYSNLYRMKVDAAKVDVIYIISGVWKPLTERFFLWIGGSRPSELIKIIVPQLERLTEQQIMSIQSLFHSSQQTEEALTQGFERLYHSLVDEIATDPLVVGTNEVFKLETLECFVNQADLLRQETLLQMSRILTIGQAAQGLLAMGEYFHGLRTLSSSWSTRSRDPGHPTQLSN